MALRDQIRAAVSRRQRMRPPEPAQQPQGAGIDGALQTIQASILQAPTPEAKKALLVRLLQFLKSLFQQLRSQAGAASPAVSQPTPPAGPPVQPTASAPPPGAAQAVR